MSARWIAFRDLPGAPTGASLPIGLGWRGEPLLVTDDLVDVDRIVQEYAAKVQTAFAIRSDGDAIYGVASHADDEPIRFALNVDERVDGWPALRDHCAVGPSIVGWRQRTALALADWTVHTPRTSDAHELDAILQARGDVALILDAWFELLGLAVPVERAADPVDEASKARAALAQAAERRRQRRLNPTPMW